MNPTPKNNYFAFNPIYTLTEFSLAWVFDEIICYFMLDIVSVIGGEARRKETTRKTKT
jgi:hypothetical protein